MISEAEMVAKFESEYPFPPLVIRPARLPGKRQGSTADAILEVEADGQKYEFAAEFRTRSTPKAFQEAMSRLAQWSPDENRHRLLVAPYLRESQLNELQQAELSGVDLCGNGIIQVPGKLLVYRTGQPNQFPDSSPSKYAYRGATSFVARVFLCRPEFDSLAEIAQEIESRGGSVALSTISKALKRLEEDLIIERSASRSWLRQGDKLLDKLAEFYQPPKVTKTMTLAIKSVETTRESSTASAGGLKAASKLALSRIVRKVPSGSTLTLAGGSSVEAYAVMGRQGSPILYTRKLDTLVKSWDAVVEETSRFVDFELLQTDDSTVYFDTRVQEELPYASPVQAYLECCRGDKREQETARDIRQVILQENSKRGGLGGNYG